MNTKLLNHLLVLALALFFLSSCEKDNLEVLPAKMQNAEVENRQVSSIQAKAFASLVANKLFTTEENGAQLKSATADDMRTVSDVLPIISENKDTVMFSVNITYFFKFSISLRQLLIYS